jgi:signal transduction histidine kinase
LSTVAEQRQRLGSVRIRTTVGATAVVGLALTIAGFVLVATLRVAMTDSVQNEAELRAEDLVTLLNAGLKPDALALDDQDGSLIQVLDTSGTIVAASSNFSGRPRLAALPPDESRTLEHVPFGTPDPYLVVARGTADRQLVVLVARSLESVREGTSALSGFLLAGMPILLTLVAVTTWIVAGRALRPVESIRREVAAISGAELSRRVPQPRGGDEVARLAQTMNAMLDRLQSSRDRQRRFVSDASHELRSPVATMRHGLEVALAHPDLTTVEALASNLLGEGLRLERLVEDLLVLARADEDAPLRTARPVDVDDLMLAEATRLRQRAIVRVDTSSVSAGRVLGDAAELARLIRNLADNAERHARYVVSLALVARLGELTLTVADDGDGIAEDDQVRIFERFTRLDGARARDAGGSGLGLAIVAAVARAHGGSVRLEPGPGARFVVVLPAIDND